MILDSKEERLLLQCMSNIRSILAAHKVLDYDPVKSVQRCADEITPYEAEKITEVRDDIPDVNDSQADGFATE